MTIDNPLPQRYYTSEEGIGGVVKDRPEDFLVDELPLYEPAGSGEHLYLRIEKIATSHSELISVIRRRFGVTEREIGFAGMKDKQAVTRQTVSVHVLKDPPDLDLGHDRIRVLWAARHRNKLRIGHLHGNRFSIRIREVDPVRVTSVLRLLQGLERTGFPNYYGDQRFGYRRNTHRLGALLLVDDYRGFLTELLGTGGSPFPEYQQERRILFDQGRYAEAAEQWTPADRNELTVIKALRDGRSERAAVRSVGKASHSFFINALQSAVFNRVLDRRIDGGTLTTLLEGDLAWKHDNGAVFLVTAQDLVEPALRRRQVLIQVSPTGPLWGEGMTQPGEAIAALERQMLAESGVPPEAFEGREQGLRGARRPLRVPAGNVEVAGGADEHGPYVGVAFDLPAGSYATVLLEEIMKSKPGLISAAEIKPGLLSAPQPPARPAHPADR